jgi:hypothetical protein
MRQDIKKPVECANTEQAVNLNLRLYSKRILSNTKAGFVLMVVWLLIIGG